MTARSFAEALQSEKLIRSARAFYAAAKFPLLARAAGCPPLNLEKGVYRITSAMSFARIFSMVSSGEQETVKVSIPEGLALSKVASRMEAAGVCPAADFIAECKGAGAAASRSLFGGSLEGYLFPDTYFFAPDTPAREAVDEMVRNFKSRALSIPALVGKSCEEIHAAVTLASIVEREYRAADEAPLIASVFSNRLEKGIGLCSCATVEYIVTEILGRPHPDVITYDDLKIDSPYNTYKWKGLPPGPISNPGLVALNAAASPAKTGYYYFRLSSADDGRHVFSADFEAHVREGAKYRTKK